MKFELESYHRDVADEDLLNDLRRVANILKKDRVTRDQYSKHGNYHYSTLAKRFGGWLKTLEKAGLKQTRIYGVTDEEYFQNLEHVWVTLGRQPRYKEIEKPLSRFSKKAYWHRFGTWCKALEQFVIYVNEEGSSMVPLAPQEIKSGHKTTRNISWRLRFIVMRRDNFRCCSCGRSPATDQNTILHVDHIKPWSKGGESIEDNLQTLCKECNIGKGNLEEVECYPSRPTSQLS